MDTKFPNEEQLKVILDNYDKLKAGLPNNDVKKLKVRDFTRRVRPYVDGERINLYALKPEIIDYIEKKNSSLDDSIETKSECDVEEPRSMKDDIMYSIETRQ